MHIWAESGFAGQGQRGRQLYLIQSTLGWGHTSCPSDPMAWPFGVKDFGAHQCLRFRAHGVAALIIARS